MACANSPSTALSPSSELDLCIDDNGTAVPQATEKPQLEDLKPLSSIIDSIGNTPLVRLNNLPQRYGIQCNVYTKLEFLNPSGSIMDRAARHILMKAEQTGQLKAGMTVSLQDGGIYDPDLAISMALCCAARGYQLNISETVKNEANQEQETTLRLLKVNVIQSAQGCGIESKTEKSSGVKTSPSDLENHQAVVGISYDNLIQEILDALNDDLHLVVLPITSNLNAFDTGNRLARLIKHRAAEVKVIGIQMKNGTEELENDPTVFDFFDVLMRVDNADAYRMAREVIRNEGLLCGTWSGAAMYAAIRHAKQLRESQNCVLIFPDGIRNFMSSLLDDEWMLKRGYMDDASSEKSAIKLPVGYKEGEVVTRRPDRRFQDCHWSSVNPDENDCPIAFKPWPGAPQRDLGESWRTRTAKGYRKRRLLCSVLNAIGETPLVRLNRIPELFGVKCEVYAKCEFMNPGASVKDRIALRMVSEGEISGLLQPGSSTIVEATSGNTGIGLGLIAAVRGYRCIITVYDTMSVEKERIVKALGAEVVRTPYGIPIEDPRSRFGVAARLQRDIPGAVFPEQFANIANPLTHYDGTSEEILYAMDDHVDMFVAGAGTGGTITGTARKFKQVCPECKIVCVDPVGSIMADPESSKFGRYEIDGIGLDFVPSTLDRSVVNKWVKCSDREAFRMARCMASFEGILCGGSSGANVAGAMQAAQQLQEHQKCVVVLPDGINNYMTKFVDEKWMRARGYDD